MVLCILPSVSHRVVMMARVAIVPATILHALPGAKLTNKRGSLGVLYEVNSRTDTQLYTASHHALLEAPLMPSIRQRCFYGEWHYFHRQIRT